MAQEHINLFMKTKEKYPRVIDAGEKLDQKPGRKFGYTEADFLEAYFGKDNVRPAALKIADGSIFGINESLKKKYPIDKYLEMPKIEAKRRAFQERLDIPATVEEARDKQFFEYLSKIDVERAETFVDKPHPTD